MTRPAIALALCALLTAGCGSRHRPVVRRSPSDAGPEDTPQVETPESPDPTPRREQPAATAGREVSLGPARLTAPESWLPKQPAQSFILAEFRLPRVEGDPIEGRLYFVKCCGPERTMAEHADEFHALVRSLGSSAPAR